MKEVLPLAREARLIIKELDDEVLVYDLDTDKAHCLNQTAALVWKYCDGKRTVDQVRKSMEKKVGSLVPEEMVWLALEQLEKFQLLYTVPARPAYLAGMKRRELVRHIGIAGLALPLIFSIVAPTAQAQASTCHNRPCVSDSDCCPSDLVCNPVNNRCKAP